MEPAQTTPEDSNDSINSKDSASKRSRKRLKSEDEEEKWLNAVESGNLHAVDDELKSIRDPKTMTARQRAMVDRKNNDDVNDEDLGHMSLSYTTTKKNKVGTNLVDEEENQRLKAMKSAKRKEIEQEKREQDRIKTMERLLNKKESGSTLNGKNVNKQLTSNTTTAVNVALQVPKISYVHRKEGTWPMSRLYCKQTAVIFHNCKQHLEFF